MSRSEERSDSPIAPQAFEPLVAGRKEATRRGHPLRWIGLAVLTLFVLVMAFLLSARSVLIEVEASAEPAIDIDGLYLPFGERLLIRPGTYTLRVTAEGYQPLQRTLTVTRADNQEVQVTLSPLPGQLSFFSKPAGAELRIDGEVLGTTPLEAIEVSAGAHTLSLSATRYLPLERELEVRGRGEAQRLELQLAPAWARITVASEPTGASILVDGELRGKTPAVLELLRGERQVQLQLAGFAPWEQTLTVEAGQPRTLPPVTLEPAAGVLALTSDPGGANVTLNERFRGQTPLQLELEPGARHRLTLSRAGYQRHGETLQMEAGERLARRISLTPQLGEVHLQVEPAAAEVRVNGETIGKGSQRLRLPTVEHRVEVALEGFATQQLRVTPREGLEQQLAITLQTRREARLARLAPEITTALGQTLKLFTPADSPLSEFTMGASRRESGRRANEVLRPVALTRMFYLQTTEVTNAQFRQFQAEHNSGQVEGNSLNREHQPVVRVSWQQAAQFCNWLSRREGLPPFYQQQQGIVTGYNPEATGYRLPTEAEWAWAARAGDEHLLKFPWGESFPPPGPVENYADNTSAYVTGRILSGYTDGYVVSAPVASFKPNSKGLYDLGGNVAEWVHDVYHIPPANGARERDPLGGQSGDNYVVRGASWALSKLSELRLSYRDYGQAGRDDVGFRLARYAE